MEWFKKTVAPTQEEYNALIEKINGREITFKETVANYESDAKQSKHDNELAISSLESDHKIALKEKEFELKHFKDGEIQAAQDKATELIKANAVLENENKMLREITNLNADIIDIKDLVASLIKKLPEINLTSLTVNSSEKK